MIVAIDPARNLTRPVVYSKTRGGTATLFAGCTRAIGWPDMTRFRTLDDLDVAGKRVLLRADLNVPMQDGRVSDATRIERLVPTIEALIAKRAKIVVMSHFGRPKGGPEAAF